MTVAPGQTATFTVQATGTAPLAYQWRRNGADIAGAISPSYTMAAVVTADNGAQFTVRISNAAGSVTSNVATLTTNTPIAPTITTQPVDATIAVNGSAMFQVVATGTAPLAYQWRRNGVDIPGANGDSYLTPAATALDDGALFAVTVSNAAGIASSGTARLSVTGAAVAPSFRTQPASTTVNIGQTASFDAIVLGTSPITYQWQRDGADIPGATAPSYTTAPLAVADNGLRFTLVARNAAGQATSTAATLTVVDNTIPAAITVQPVGASVLDGFTASFSVTASGGAPLSYQWRRNGVSISGANGASYTTPPVALSDDGALFSVVVSNATGTQTSTEARLTVSSVAPTISANPVSQTVTAPAGATFSVSARGSAPLQYQWLRNGVDIAGAQASTYTLGATTTADDGAVFSVRVTNAAGTATSASATLNVAAGGLVPTIVAQPQALSLPAGTAASFSVAVRGSAPFAYQWRRNGVDIAGATASAYSTPATTVADNGAVFTVVVSNAAGSTTSSPAALAVGAAVAFPSTRIRIVVPTAAGNSLDLAARDFALAMSEDQGWTVIVDNVPGGNGTTGMAQVAGSLADGHTLLFGNHWMATASTFYRRLAFSPLGDFEHLGLVGGIPMVMVGAQALPAGTYPTLATWLDGQTAGSVRIGYGGLGSRSYLCALLFAQRDGHVLTRVAYAGTAPALSDLLGGQLDLLCDGAPQAQIDAGRIRAYAVTGLERSVVPALAVLPTLDESGLPGFDATDWHSLHAPRGTPSAVVARLNAALRTAMVNPGFVTRRTNAGARPAMGAPLTPSGHLSFLQSEADKWRPLIQGAGLYAD